MSKKLSLALCLMTATAFGNSIPLRCLHTVNDISDATILKVVNSEAQGHLEKAKAFMSKNHEKLSERYPVLRPRIKELPSLSYNPTKSYGIEMEYCDDTDYGQANCLNYIFRAGGEYLELVAVYDIPHSGAEESITFICE